IGQRADLLAGRQGRLAGENGIELPILGGDARAESGIEGLLGSLGLIDPLLKRVPPPDLNPDTPAGGAVLLRELLRVLDQSGVILARRDDDVFAERRHVAERLSHLLVDFRFREFAVSGFQFALNTDKPSRIAIAAADEIDAILSLPERAEAFDARIVQQVAE